ncbi:MAG: EamA family transporter [Actinomycetota bacterium]
MRAEDIGTRVAPEGLFAVGAISQYVGAAIAVGLFDDIDAPGVALLRVLGAALIVIAIRRPWRRAWTRAELAWTAAFGVALAGMNLFFYLAIDELPLGNAVAFEFLGPIVVASLGARSARNASAVVLAVSGVVLLAGVQPEGSAQGVAFALAAGAAWAGYIVLGHRVARAGISVDGLGLGMLLGAGAIAIVGASDLGPAFDTPGLLLLALSTGLFSNAIPYAIDQLVLQRIDQYRFALLQAMLPVSAALIGLIALSQTPTGGEVVGIALVVVALVVRGRSAT